MRNAREHVNLDYNSSFSVVSNPERLIAILTVPSSSFVDNIPLKPAQQSKQKWHDSMRRCDNKATRCMIESCDRRIWGKNQIVVQLRSQMQSSRMNENSFFDSLS